jgi:hypothetical protein
VAPCVCVSIEDTSKGKQARKRLLGTVAVQETESGRGAQARCASEVCKRCVQAMCASKRRRGVQARCASEVCKRGKQGVQATHASMCCLIRFLDLMRGALTAAPSREEPVSRMPLTSIMVCISYPCHKGSSCVHRAEHEKYQREWAKCVCVCVCVVPGCAQHGQGQRERDAHGGEEVGVDTLQGLAPRGLHQRRADRSGRHLRSVWVRQSSNGWSARSMGKE